MLTSVSFLIFILYPVSAPKPVVAHPAGMYRLLLFYDAPLNSFPSLHAGLLIYTLAFGRRIFGKNLPPGLGAVCIGWGGLILYATLATKEHFAVDIFAGIILALLADVWVWRHALEIIDEVLTPRPMTSIEASAAPPPGRS